MSATQPGVITPGRQPFEIGAFGAMLVVGLLGVCGATSPAVQTAMPSWFVTVFYGVLAFWAAVALVGLSLRDVELRLKIERIACYGVGYCALAYGLSALIVTGWSAATAAIGVGWISPAAAWRIRQIHVDLRRLREVLVHPAELDDGGERP